MSTQTQPWLRAELIAAPETAPGAQLMIPADTVEFHDDQLVFHHQGDIVYVAPQAQLRSIAWFARQPNPETARRRAQWPNHGTRWTDEEREDLLRHLAAGTNWKAISHTHGRSRSGCQQEAVKQGWVDPDTLRVKPELLAGPGRKTGAADAAQGDLAADSGTVADSSSGSGSGSEAQPASIPTTNSANANALADTPPNAVPASPAPDRHAVTTGFSDSLPSAASPGPGRHSTAESSVRSHATANLAPGTPGTANADPASAAPHMAPRDPTPETPSVATPQPDRPRFPPRIPRQRTSPDPDPGPDKDPDPAPGSSFLSRAQSSLARATFGAYLPPPPDQPGAASSAT